MYATSTYVASRNAHHQIEDRIRNAESRRLAREVRAAARERRYVEDSDVPTAAWNSRLLQARTATA
jgi:hypothetical protein